MRQKYNGLLPLMPAWCRQPVPGWLDPFRVAPAIRWFGRGGTAFCLVVFQLIDIGQDFGCSGIQLGRDFLAKLGIEVQCAGKRRGAQDGDLVFAAELDDTLGDQVRAFGDHRRGGHAAALVTQCHCVMGRVGHNHVGFRYLGHHPLARRFALQGTDACLDVRVAFRFLRFLAQLFLGHAQAAAVVPQLEGHIEHHQYDDRTHHHLHGKTDQVCCMAETRFQ